MSRILLNFLVVIGTFPIWIFGCKEDDSLLPPEDNKEVVEKQEKKEQFSWIVDASDKQLPAPVVQISSPDKLKITVGKPESNQYPRVRLWHRGEKIPANTGYTLEVEARIDAPERQGNVLFGYNVRPNEGDQRSFQHWHMLMGNGTRDYRADWTENMWFSGVPVDDQWHNFRIEYDGKDELRFFLDGLETTEMKQWHTFGRLEGDAVGTFTIYFERYPKIDEVELSDIYILEIRKFSTTIGTASINLEQKSDT